jgi:hypothetical protein
VYFNDNSCRNPTLIAANITKRSLACQQRRVYSSPVAVGLLRFRLLLGLRLWRGIHFDQK